MADAFHHTAYQLLFTANRVHRDIQTAVSFLTTRVQSPDEDNWEKLKQIFKYLNGTKKSQANALRRSDKICCALVR